MNNYSNDKRTNYKGNPCLKNHVDTNPSLTEKSIEKTLENNKNSRSKNLFHKNVYDNIKMNKSSKSSDSSTKNIINLNTNKSKSKKYSKNKSSDHKNKITESKNYNINGLLKSSFSINFRSMICNNYKIIF